MLDIIKSLLIHQCVDHQRHLSVRRAHQDDQNRLRRAHQNLHEVQEHHLRNVHHRHQEVREHHRRFVRLRALRDRRLHQHNHQNLPEHMLRRQQHKYLVHHRNLQESMQYHRHLNVHLRLNH